MRKQDYAKGGGPMFSGKTRGSKGIGSIRRGVSAQPESGPGMKAYGDVGWPGVASSSLGPDDHSQSAK